MHSHCADCRYKILRSLGSGTYGKVVECWDRQVIACIFEAHNMPLMQNTFEAHIFEAFEAHIFQAHNMPLMHNAVSPEASLCASLSPALNPKLQILKTPTLPLSRRWPIVRSK